jgi:hypothetical protein
MDIAWTTEVGIFEVMMLDVADGVGHVGFAREEGSRPEFFAVAENA